MRPTGIMNKLLLIIVTLCLENVRSLFIPGKEYTYTYNATSSTGILLPSGTSSSWGLYGKLVVQGGPDIVLMQLQSLKMNMWNGNDSHQEGIDIDIKEIIEPFEVKIANGLLQNISIQNEPLWVTNIKRSIAGIFQLDLLNLKQHLAFHSTEMNHYGQCNIAYSVSFDDDNEKLVRKYLDPSKCIGHPEQIWSNVAKLKCHHNFRQSVLKSSERQYKIKLRGTTHQIISVNTSGGIIVESFKNYEKAQFHFTQQKFNLISVKNITRPISINGSHFVTLQHQFLGSRNIHSAIDKESVFLIIEKLLDDLSESLERTSLDIDTKNLHNATLPALLHYLRALNQVDLQFVYDQMLGNSGKETLRNIFMEILPQIGTCDAAVFILNLITQKKLMDATAIQLIAKLPFYLRNLSVSLLVDLQSFLNLPAAIHVDVKHTAILAYGTLIYKTCNLNCTSEMLDDYIHFYFNKFTEAVGYRSKMVWLQGLANIQLGKVAEIMETIVSGINADLNNFRVLAAWRSILMATSRPNHMYSVYWPILVNRTEVLEMRVIALTLLLTSDATPRRLISLYWYMKTEPCPHLYNYFYTTLKSIVHATHPCYIQMSDVAAQLIHILRKPIRNINIMTIAYLFDYKDMYKNFGRMVNGILVANPLTNIPEVIYLTLNNYGNDISTNDISLYVRAKGLQNLLPTFFNNSTQIKDLLQHYKLHEKRKSTPLHLEVAMQVQDKTIFYKHLNEKEISNTFLYLSNLTNNVYYVYQNMDFHINQQHVHIPLTTEFVQASELGTDLRHDVTVTSFFSIRGSFTHSQNGVENHITLHSSSHRTEVIENYNPFVDLWYTAEKSQSVYGYIPVNITAGFKEHFFILYDIPKECMKTGFIGHVKRTTNIKGIKVYQKLRDMCPMCPIEYTDKQLAQDSLETIHLFDASLSEFGGEVYIKMYGCEDSTTKQQLTTDIITSHQANHQDYLALKGLLIGLHILDYISYAPPKSNCGVAVYIETSKSQHNRVKFTFAKNELHYMFSLIHTDLNSGKILHQWNLVALYEATTSVSDTIKIKATRVASGEAVTKVCFEAERIIPLEWDILNTKPSNPFQLKLNVVWGLSNTAKGKCNGSSVQLNLYGKITNEQINESKTLIWPYAKCHEEQGGKTFVPYTDACYEASRELSTFRKYEIFCRYENLPDTLSRLIWKLCAIYDVVDGNSTCVAQSKDFLLTVTFPKESTNVELQVNQHKFSIQHDVNFIEYFLIRTRIHTYMDILHQSNFFSTCIVTPDAIRSSHNRSFPLEIRRNILLLGQCYNDNPLFAIIAENVENSVTVTFIHESNTTKIVAYENGGALYNPTMSIPVERNFVFHNINFIRVRMDETSVDLLFPSLLLYMHWTQEQVLLFFPNHLLESSCGICLEYTSSTNDFYEKLE